MEIKNNLQGKNSSVDKAEIKSIIWNIRNQKQPIRTTRRKKNPPPKKRERERDEDTVSSLQDNFKCTNTHIIGVLEGEEKEQEIRNLFEKIMEENFLNLVKEIDIQAQEAQRVLNKVDAKRPTPRHVIIKTPKVEDKERIIKAAREKQLVTYRGVPIRLSVELKTNFVGQKGWARNILCHEKQGPTTKISLPSKDIIQNRRTDKELSS